MSPSVDVTQATFNRLQSHAIPLVDTVETVINRMIDEYEKKKLSAESVSEEGVRKFNVDAPPDLTHAKILGVSFAGEKLGRSEDNWNGLLNKAVIYAKANAKSSAEFEAMMVVNHVKGDKQDEGYRPLPSAGISVQGQDANGAWRAVRSIAQHLGCGVTVKFAWREKDGAAFPGVIGQMIIPAK